MTSAISAKHFKRRKELVAQMIRVDHAGETAAALIYEGQLAAMNANAPEREKIMHMKEQEDRHLSYFQDLIDRRGVRTTVMLPVWKVIAYCHGYITGMVGSRAAMLYTAAVEETIDLHYEEQLDLLRDGYEEESELIAAIEKFREEENEHKDEALEVVGDIGFFGFVFSAITKSCCRLAIRISSVI